MVNRSRKQFSTLCRQQFKTGKDVGAKPDSQDVELAFGQVNEGEGFLVDWGDRPGAAEEVAVCSGLRRRWVCTARSRREGESAGDLAFFMAAGWSMRLGGSAPKPPGFSAWDRG